MILATYHSPLGSFCGILLRSFCGIHLISYVDHSTYSIVVVCGKHLTSDTEYYPENWGVPLVKTMQMEAEQCVRHYKGRRGTSLSIMPADRMTIRLTQL